MSEQTHLDKKYISYKFRECVCAFLAQQPDNVRSAAIVDTARIMDLFDYPIVYIGESDSANANTYFTGYLSNKAIFSEGTTRRFLKGANCNIISKIAKDYISRNIPREALVNNNLESFTSRIEGSKCLSKFARECFDTLVNYISHNIDNDMEFSPTVEVDMDPIFSQFADRIGKGMFNFEIDELSNSAAEASEMIKKFTSDNFSDNIVVELKDQAEIRKAILQDFILNGYAAYGSETVVSGGLKLKHYRNGSYMFLWKDTDTIDIFVQSYFSDYSRDMAVFDIYIMNEEGTYSLYSMDCKYEDLKNILLDDRKTYQFYHRDGSEEPAVFNKLPFFVKRNCSSSTYGFPKISPYFEYAMRLKLAEHDIDWDVLKNTNPAIIMDTSVINNTFSQNKTIETSVSNVGEGKIHPGQIVAAPAQDEIGAPVVNRISPVVTTLSQASALLRDQRQYAEVQLSTIFHNNDLIRYKSLPQTSMVNGQKVVDNIITNVSEELNFYKKVIDANSNLALREHLGGQINLIKRYVESAFKYKDEQAKNFFKYFIYRYGSKGVSFNPDAPMTIEIFLILWFFYALVANDLGDIKLESKEDVKNAPVKLYKHFTTIDKFFFDRVQLVVSGGSRYSTESAKKTLTDLAMISQVQSALGIMPAAAFNTTSILEMVRESPLEKFLNTPQEYKKISEDILKHIQQTDVDTPQAAVEAQRG